MQDFRNLLRESDYSLKIRDLASRVTPRTSGRTALPSAMHLPIEGDDGVQFAVQSLADHRHFEPIAAGAFRVSVQASKHHSCTPEITTDDLTRYTAWEVWLGPTGHDLLRLMPDLPPSTDRTVGVDAFVTLYFVDDEDNPDPACRVPTAVVQRYLDIIENASGGGPDIGAYAGTESPLTSKQRR